MEKAIYSVPEEIEKKAKLYHDDRLLSVFEEFQNRPKYKVVDIGLCGNQHVYDES